MKLIEIVKYIAEHPNSGFFYTPSIYPSAKSYFFSDVVKEIIFNQNGDFRESLRQIDNYCEKGLTAFGYIGYEFGYLFEERLKELIDEENDKDLFHFLFCDTNSVKAIDSNDIDYSEIENHIGGKVIENFSLNTSKDVYIKNVKKIESYIEEGDTYQVNYTVKSKFNLSKSIIDLFAQLIFSQSARYTALMNFGDKIILSSSPELFFEIDGDSINVKPMKGTIRRGKNFFEDEKKKKELLDSKKDRAENIMIVDLLRNDIGKICDYGSVEVTNKYNLEKYESVHQLTSDIIGKLNTNKISDTILNLFPSGSITGAPKLRTMQIINELEKESRGIYTGLIGMFSKNRSVANVAIRTLEIDNEKRSGELGIGSGIIWDSEPEKEYDEVLLKSKFLTEPLQYFELIESMLYQDGTIFLLDYHLLRLKEATSYFLFKYDEKSIQKELEKAVAELDKNNSYKIRLTLSKWGSVSITSDEISDRNERVNVIISDKRIDTQNRFQYFKTTNRNHYDRELKKFQEKGYSDVLFLNEKGNVGEGARTNIVIKTGEKLVTPPIQDGILDGCYRRYLLNRSKGETVETVDAKMHSRVTHDLNRGIVKEPDKIKNRFNGLPIQEQSITLKQLINSEKVILINSVRKELVVNKIFDANGKLLKELN